MMERIVKILQICFLGLILLCSSEASSCPNKEGWIESENQCLELSNDKNVWTSANEECKAKSGRLVSIGNDEQQQDLLKLLKSATQPPKSKDKFWIGAYVPALVFRSYFNRCIDGYDFRNRTCFQILPEFLQWKKAKEVCEELGGKLASIEDEDENKFVAAAMTSMFTKHNIKSDTTLSYWIDGYSDGNSLKFFDSNEKLLTYTNFMPSTVQNGTSCLEIFPKKPAEDGFTSEDTINATAAELYADMDNLSTLGIPDAITQTTVVSYSSSSYSSHETNTLAPLYNIMDCNEKRLAVCEFSLRKNNEQEDENVSSQADDDDKPGTDKEKTTKTLTVHPSYLFSCMQLARIFHFVEKMKENEKIKEKDIEALFVNPRNGHYIIQSEEESASLTDKNNTAYTQYKVKYCDIDRLKSSLKSAKETESFQLFNWPSVPFPLESEQQTDFKEFNLLNTRSIYNGPCVYASSVSGNWETSRCSDKAQYVCEYSPEAIKKHFCSDEGDWCKDLPRDYLKDLNADSSQLLEQLESSAMAMETTGYASVLGSMKEMVSKAQRSLADEKAVETTEESVRNFTKNIVRAASILTQTTATGHDSSETQNNQGDVIETVNSVTEYAADAIGTLMRQTTGNRKNITEFSVTSDNIDFRIFVVGNGTSELGEHLLESYSYFSSSEGEEIEIKMSDIAKELSDIHGVSFINVQYKYLESTLLDVPISSLEMSDNLIVHTFNSESNGEINLNNKDDQQKYTKGTKYSIIATNILTATLRINGTNYPTDVRFSLPKKPIETNLEIIPDSEMCSFLDDKAEESSWSGRGCHRVFRLIDDGRYHCECNHTTDFAVLLLVFEQEVDILEGHREILSVLALIGHILTILCLTISTILFMYLKRDLKSDRRAIHVNLFLALLLAHIILVIASWSKNTDKLNVIEDSNETTLDPRCIVFTYFSHVLLLSAIFWMLVEGIVIYRKIVVVLSRQSNSFSNMYYVIGWGIPVGIATICICIGLLTEKEYHSSGCWLSISSGMIWAFAAPAIFVLVANAIIMILVLKVAVRTQKRKIARLSDVGESTRSKMTRAAYLKTTTRGVIVLTPLLGFTWMIGLLMFHVTMAYFFVILNAFQGVFIFGCYCICNQEVRTALATRWRHYKARQFSTVPDDRLHSNGQRRDNKAKFITNRLLMRLSFSITSSRQVNEVSLSPENSSRAVDKFANNGELSHGVDEISPMSSPASSRCRSGKSRFSVSTHSTSLSHQSLSLTSLRSDGASQHRPPHAKKMTTRVRPLSSEESNKIVLNAEWELRRPFSADAVLSRNYFGCTQETTPHINGVADLNLARLVEPEHDVLHQPNHVFSYSSGNCEMDKSQVEKNPAVEVEDDCESINISKGELSVNATPMLIINGNILSDDHHCSINATSTDLSFRASSANEKSYNLCSRQYYNIFSDEVPIPLYSDAWTRKMKPKKRPRMENKNSKNKNPHHNETCMSRSCQQCHPRDRRTMSASSGKYGNLTRKFIKPRSARSNVASTLRTVSNPAIGTNSPDTNSTTRRESEMLPVDVETT